MKKILYITVSTPLNLGEAFVLTEMISLKKAGVDLLIIPRDVVKNKQHKKAEELIDNTLVVPWVNIRILREVIKFNLKHPLTFVKVIKNTVLKARNIRIALKNLGILPKSVYLSSLLRQEEISHIHAHWGSTTSTMGYVISTITGIPWSFTVHRWDIPENNILKEKCKTAAFVRTIDKQGKNEVIEILNDAASPDKIKVLHLGVEIPLIKQMPVNEKDEFVFICPANFVLKKGHSYLLEACKILKDKNIKFKCLFSGDGALEPKLKKMSEDLKLDGYVEFIGRLAHEELFDLYDNRKIDALVLPSIVAENGEKEGIPVVLMEAMAYGIPVISTYTGGIPELVDNRCGILVEQKNSKAIADAIEKLLSDPGCCNNLGKLGREKIMAEFNGENVSTVLLGLFNGNMVIDDSLCQIK
jgi:colanic acid/amylovoran biosynthesis glycosyltransferase